MSKRPFVLAVLIFAAGPSGLHAEENLAAQLQAQEPAFADALIARIEGKRALSPAPACGGDCFAAAAIAEKYLSGIVQSGDRIEMTCAVGLLKTRGQAGERAAATLQAMVAPMPEPRTDVPARASVASYESAARAIPASFSGSMSLGQMNRAYDNSANAGQVLAVADPGVSKAASAGGAAQASQPQPFEPGRIAQIVSEPHTGLQRFFSKQAHNEISFPELKQNFFNVSGVGIGGSGVHKDQLLTKAQVDADPIKRQATEQAHANGQGIAWIKTTTKAQLFGNAVAPQATLGPGALTFAVNFGGIVEIVENKAIPASSAKETIEHGKRRLHQWPLTAEHIRRTFSVGEDVMFTGHVTEGAGLGLGVGQFLGDLFFFRAGAGVQGSLGASKDDWVSLYVKKIDNDHVRVVIRKGDGLIGNERVALTAGISTYNTDIIPNSFDNTMFGAAATKGGVKLFGGLVNKLFSAELAENINNGRHNSETQGWGSVSLTDPAQVDALNRLFHFHADRILALTTDSTFSGLLRSGRIVSRIKDVTKDEVLQGRLSVLKLVHSEGTRFYEIQTRVDQNQPEHYLVGIVDRQFKEDLFKTKHSSQSELWCNLQTNQCPGLFVIGPEVRKFTSTEDRLNDTKTVQRLLGLEVPNARVHDNHWCVDALGIEIGVGCLGRTEDQGYLSVTEQGTENLRAATKEAAIRAYLQSLWEFEKGRLSAKEAAEKTAPIAGPKASEYLRYMAENAEGIRQQYRDYDINSRDVWNELKVWQMQDGYQSFAPKRELRFDVEDYLLAERFAKYIGEMRQAGGAGHHLIELFLKFRKDEDMEMKRTAAAIAILAGRRADSNGQSVPNYTGWMQMKSKKGDRVMLVPNGNGKNPPLNPVDRINATIADWTR